LNSTILLVLLKYITTCLGLDGILNKVFKIAILIIIKDLAEIASYYFANKIILKSLKKSIIVVLRKEEKKTIFS